ncbi:MAG: gamma-glutamyl-gamma-aminobutyrate hydrolase family protein [Planctomycetota bacterium]
MSRPRIAVSGPDRGGAAAWWATAWAIWRSGGVPVRLRPGVWDGSLPADALVVGGGADIDSGRYRQELARVMQAPPARPLVAGLLALLRLGAARTAIGPDRERDAMEWRLIDQARRRRLPVLGICRGAQLLNVHAGGDLHQDVADLHQEHPRVHSLLPHKRIHLRARSRLARVLGARACRVNGLHHQAIRQLGRGLQVVAWERAGVVQAVEAVDAPLQMGVQWHPEYLPQLTRQLRLFRVLVAAARRCATARQ